MNAKNKGKPSGCSKVKNPCKYCFETVTNKNGLQCQGACKKWAHFKCLNYTPGKISDIKAGLIKVTCPCPDCATTQQKEYLANPPYTCSNPKCPANNSPKCESVNCPIHAPQNKGCPLPVVDYPKVSSCHNKDCSNVPTTCPGYKSQSPRSGTPPRPKKCMSPPELPKIPRQTRSRSPPPLCPKVCDEPKPQGITMARKVVKTRPQSPKKSPSLSLLSLEGSGGCSKPQSPRCETPPRPKKCNKCSPTSTSDTDLCLKTRQNKAKPQATVVETLQEMCSTVGKLSIQLKELMCKLTQN